MSNELHWCLKMQPEMSQSPLVHRAVNKALQLVLEVLLGCVLAGLSTWKQSEISRRCSCGVTLYWSDSTCKDKTKSKQKHPLSTQSRSTHPPTRVQTGAHAVPQYRCWWQNYLRPPRWQHHWSCCSDWGSRWRRPRHWKAAHFHAALLLRGKNQTPKQIKR